MATETQIQRSEKIRYLRIAATSIVFFLAGVYVIRHWRDLAVIFEIPVEFLLLILGLQVLQMLLSGVVFKLNTELAGASLPIREWLGLRLISQFANYLAVFRGGSALAFGYLKARHKLSLKKLLAIFVVTSGVGAYSLAPAVLLLGVAYCFPGAPLVTAVGGALALILTWFALPLLGRMLDSSGNVIGIHAIERTFALIQENLRNWHFVLLCYWLILLFAALSFQITFHAYGLDASFLGCLAIVVASTASSLVSITPGNLGVQEAIVAYLSTFLGDISFEQGIVVGSLIRASSMVLTITGAMIYSRLLFGTTKPRVPDGLEVEGGI